MQKVILLSLFLLPQLFFGQQVEKQIKVFKEAMNYNDYTAATQAVYNILAEGEKYEGWRDTLAYLYFNRGGYMQCARVSNDILSKNPNNLAALEMLAVSEQSTGFLKESLGHYVELYGKSKNIYHLYEISTLQYSLQSYQDALATITTLLSDPSIEEKKIAINVNQNQRQTVGMRAAVYNIQGVVYKALGEKEKAQTSFQAAIKLEPEFILPKNNLEYLDK